MTTRRTVKTTPKRVRTNWRRAYEAARAREEAWRTAAGESGIGSPEGLKRQVAAWRRYVTAVEAWGRQCPRVGEEIAR